MFFFFHTIIFSRHTNISFIYTHHLQVIITLSLVFLCVSSCFGWFGFFVFFFKTCSSRRRKCSVCVFVSQRFCGSRCKQASRLRLHCSSEPRDDVSASLLRSISFALFSLAFLFSFFFLLSLYLFWMFNFVSMSVGDYPYNPPHSNWANISETGPQSVSTTGGLRGLLCVTWKWFKEGVSPLWWTFV